MQLTQKFPLPYRRPIAPMLALYLLLGSAVPAITADVTMFNPSINFAKSQLKRRNLPFVWDLSRVFGETMGVLQFGIRTFPDFGAFSICDAPPHGAMVQAFTDWAEKNPQEWKNPAILGVMTAPRETWPCER